MEFRHDASTLKEFYINPYVIFVSETGSLYDTVSDSSEFYIISDWLKIFKKLKLERGEWDLNPCSHFEKQLSRLPPYHWAIPAFMLDTCPADH